jgi:hypothetical protein
VVFVFKGASDSDWAFEDGFNECVFVVFRRLEEMSVFGLHHSCIERLCVPTCSRRYQITNYKMFIDPYKF